MKQMQLTKGAERTLVELEGWLRLAQDHTNANMVGNLMRQYAAPRNCGAVTRVNDAVFGCDRTDWHDTRHEATTKDSLGRPVSIEWSAPPLPSASR